jgi:hypothetical protein
MSLTVCCVLKSGGVVYGPEWVARLKRNVERFAPAHRFVCLSDVAVPAERIPLTDNLPGWWSILEIFRPGLFEGRVLYLDLANLIVGKLDVFFAGTGFVIAPDPWEVGPGRFASGAMAFDAGDCEIHDRFERSVMERLRGDQDWITELRPDAATFPIEWCVSYRGQCRGKGVPNGARIIFAHGPPKPLQIGDKWYRRRWDRDWPK